MTEFEDKELLERERSTNMNAEAGEGQERAAERLAIPSQEATSGPQTEIDFDLDGLRLGQDYSSEFGGRKIITRIPTRKPDRFWWFRTHPSDAYRMDAGIIELKEEREVYIVHASLAPDLGGDVKRCTIFTCITRQGTLFLWPIPLPSPDGRHNPWHQSAMTAADLATRHWIRISADMNLGAYSIMRATGELGDPEWPDLDFPSIAKIAFTDNIISSPEHPVLRRLRGHI